MRPSSADTSRARLREAEDVVDEEQHVLALLVAEVLGHGHAGQPDAQARAGRLVHLAEDHHRLGDDARLRHLEVEVVALAGALADAGEHREAAVLGGDVADQLLDEHRLADAGAAEQADLAAAHVGREQVDDLDAGLEQLGRGLLLLERRRGAVDRVASSRSRPAALPSMVSPSRLKMRPRHCSPTGTVIGPPGVHGLHAAHQAVGRGHGDAAHDVVADVQRHLDGQVDAPRGVLDADGVEDAGQLVRTRTPRPPWARSPARLVRRSSRSPSPGARSARPRRALLQRFRAADDLRDLLRDRGLAQAVPLQDQLVDQLARVLASPSPSPPCARPCSLARESASAAQHPGGGEARQQRREDGLAVRARR